MTTVAGRLTVVAGALALTLAVTWPLARCFGTCLGAPPDTLLSIYFLRWVAHSLTTSGVRLLDAPMFAPYAKTLALGEYIPAYVPLALPTLLAAGNPVAAHNVVVVAAYTLAAVGAAALAARLLGATAPALLAGVIFAYSPRLLHQAHNLQALSAFWVPWLFLAVERFLARPTWAAAGVIAGIGLGLALSSMIAFMYAGVALLVALGVAVVWGGRRIGRAHVLRAVGVGVPMAGLLALYLAPYRALARDWRLGRSLDEVERYSVSLGDYLGVPPEHLLHRLIGLGRVVDLDREALFPGLTVAVLAAIGLRAVLRERDGVTPRLAPIVAMAGVAAILALGPTWRTAWGPVPLPYRVLYGAVPGFDSLRTPRRFAVFVAFALALLAAAGAARLLRRVDPMRRRWAVVGLAALILVESLAVPFPGAVSRLDPAELPAVYRWLAREPPHTVAVAVPMGDWVNVAASAFHLRRTVNGWSSYLPPRYADLVEAMEAFPDARTMALIRGVHPDVVLIDRGWLTPARAAALARLEAGLRLDRVFPTHLVYRLAEAPPPGVETLEAAARVESPRPQDPPRACVSLRNTGPGFVPLYPLRRLRLQAESAGMPAPVEDWLPLDLAPGASHVACVALGRAAGSFLMRGTVAGAGHVHRFAVAPDGPPQPLERDR